MSGDASLAATGGGDVAQGHHHHHHYYYFYPAGAVPPAPHPHSHPQPLAQPTRQDWAGPLPGVPAAAHPEHHGHPHPAHGHHHLGDNDLVKGLLVGAGVGFLLTNEAVQKNLIRTVVRLWSAAQGGVEEMKERFRDAEAEIKAAADKP